MVLVFQCLPQLLNFLAGLVPLQDPPPLMVLWVLLVLHYPVVQDFLVDQQVQGFQCFQLFQVLRQVRCLQQLLRVQAALLHPGSLQDLLVPVILQVQLVRLVR